MWGTGWYLILVSTLAICTGHLVPALPATTGCAGHPDHRYRRYGLIRAPISPDWIQTLNCTWIIESSAADRVTVSFSSLQLPCALGSLTLGRVGQEPHELCGALRPPSLSVFGGSVRIHLLSGYSSRPAFHIFYSTASVCHPGQTLCPSGDCSSDPLHCSVRPSPAPPLSVPCPTQKLRSFFGSFSSPDLESAAPRPARRCLWRLDTGDPRPLELTLDLSLAPGDRVLVAGEEEEGGGRALAEFAGGRGRESRTVQAPSGTLLVRYLSRGGPTPGGFSASFRVQGYCPPSLLPCQDGGLPSCYAPGQRCDGRWDCERGGDEEGCPQCPAGHYPCGAGSGGICYQPSDRCDYQSACPRGEDESGCRWCQPGTFLCAEQRCVFESWVCDGQPDCAGGDDERGCRTWLPRKVTTAAAVGSLVCGLLLVLAVGCTCKLYALRSSQYSLFSQLAWMESEIVQQRAPPSYGQLIADGAIPPVQDFPTENPNDVSVLGNLRSMLQLLRQAPPQPRRRRRNRALRRLFRRLRRSRLWALLRPSPAPDLAQPSTPEPSADPSPPPSRKPTLPGGPDPPLAQASDPDPGDTALSLHPVDLPLLPLGDPQHHRRPS